MALCDSSSDCRGGYACVDLSEDNTWSAAIVSRKPEGHKVCIVAESHPEAENRADDFCSVQSGAGGAGGASTLDDSFDD